MQGENPWDKMSDVDGSRRSSARVQHKFCALIVEVKHGVEVAVAEENFAFQLQMKFVSVFFYSFQEAGALGVGCRILL